MKKAEFSGKENQKPMWSYESVRHDYSSVCGLEGAEALAGSYLRHCMILKGQNKPE